MQTNYQVVLAVTAQKTYESLSRKAGTGIKGSNGSNRRVSLLASVNDALNELVSIDPFDSRLALAGYFSMIYMLKRDFIRVYYMADKDPAVINIIHIGTHRLDTDISWLRSAFRNGEIEVILQHLGINDPIALADVHSLMLN